MNTKTILGLTFCLLLSLVFAASPISEIANELLKETYVPMEQQVNMKRQFNFNNKIRSWNLVSSSSPKDHQYIHLTFALKNSNVEKLKEIFNTVSDPSHPNHENYLTMEQVAKLTTPSSENKQIVIEWIKSIPSAMIKSISKHENFIEVLMQVQHVNKYLKTNLSTFIREDNKKQHHIIRSTNGYALPKKIANVVQFVRGLTNFPIKFKARKVEQLEVDEQFKVTPTFIRQRYNITVSETVSPQSSQAVASFLEQYISASDLSTFQKEFNLPKVYPKVYGPNEDNNPGEEATLDIQYLTGVGYKINTTIFSTPGINNITQQEPFIEWITFIQSLGDSNPWVHSVSYGDIEYETTVEYAQQLDVEFLKLGVTGRTILIASGDNGVRCNDNGNQFQPEWPTSSEYVTSVGATLPSSQNYEESTSWSGGGFSNLFTTPQWQKETVKAYLAQNSIPATSYFNVNGRAYPDVSAFGIFYQIMFKGEWKSIGGTSASTPTFAGVVSLLNDLRFKAGKKSLGFLNFWIYQHVSKVPGAFYDIVVGRNGVYPCPGFPATKGWDAISGWGVPNFAVLKHLALLK
ncbi:hypothetical protein ABK040_015814 [Willaertia magna]